MALTFVCPNAVTRRLYQVDSLLAHPRQTMATLLVTVSQSLALSFC